MSAVAAEAVLLLIGALVPACGAEEGKTITMTAQEYRFSPSAIRLQAGQRVRLVFQNHGTVNHEFMSPIFKSAKDIEIQSQSVRVEGDDISEVEVRKGKVVEIAFTPSAAGTFQFWCAERVGAKLHRDLGMRGTATAAK